jgi:hypothetical protein
MFWLIRRFAPFLVPVLISAGIRPGIFFRIRPWLSLLCPVLQGGRGPERRSTDGRNFYFCWVKSQLKSTGSYDIQSRSQFAAEFAEPFHSPYLALRHGPNTKGNPDKKYRYDQAQHDRLAVSDIISV